MIYFIKEALKALFKEKKKKDESCFPLWKKMSSYS